MSPAAASGGPAAKARPVAKWAASGRVSSASSGGTKVEKLCPVDGKPCKPNKRWCYEHQRAEDNMRKNAFKNNPKDIHDTLGLHESDMNNLTA